MSGSLPAKGSRVAAVARLLLIAMGVVFLLPFVFALLTWDRTTTALPALRFALLGVCPTVSAFAFYAASRASPATQINAVLAATASIFAIYIGELVIPYGLQLRTLAAVEAERDTPIDRRDKVEVLLDTRTEGINATTSIEPKGLLQFDTIGPVRSRLTDEGAEFLPLSGVSRSHTIVCNELGSWITYESDRFGMNNPDHIWDLDQIDVAVVGDSFTNGWCVPAEQHFTGLIRERYGRLVNLAQSGNGPLIIQASIVEYLEERQPDAVLWFHYEGNDFEDLWVERSSPLLRGYLDGTTHQRLSERQDAVDERVSEYIESELERWRTFGQLAVRRPSMTLDAARVRSLIKLDNLRTLAGLTYTSTYNPDYETFGTIMEKAATTVASWEGSLYLVYLPSWFRYRRTDLAHRYAEAHGRVLSQVEDLGIHVIDVATAFADEPDPLSLFVPIDGGTYGHFSARGNSIVAEVVLDALEHRD